jgi:6-hydroxytryprostatin B O-methyltransferase
MAIAQSHRIEAALQYASHFCLATYVPIEEGSSITFTALSIKAGVPTQQCTRILRLLMTCHIFHEPQEGAVAHTPDSKLLLDEHIEAMVGYWTDESFRAAAFFSSAAEKWPESQERNDTALNMAFDTRLPKFDFFDAEPWRARRFRKAMAGMTRGDRFRLEHLVNGFSWASLPDGATVVDVGGGGGHCSIAIAAANPGLRFIVQDLKSAFDTTAVPASLKSRIQFMEHDFFTPQPSLGQVYFLRWILHDYPDKFACRILQAQLSAMRPGTKLIVMEAIMLPPGTQGKLDERKSR